MSKRRSEDRNTLATFFAATVCRTWKSYTPSVRAHTHCQPFLQSINANFSQSRWLFGPPCGILCIKQRHKLLRRGVLIYGRYFQTKRQGGCYFHPFNSGENIQFSRRNRSFPQLSRCHKRLLQNLMTSCVVYRGFKS